MTKFNKATMLDTLALVRQKQVDLVKAQNELESVLRDLIIDLEQALEDEEEHAAAMFQPIEITDFPDGLLKVLHRAGIDYLGDILQRSAKELKEIKGLGRAYFREIDEWRDWWDFEFGTEIKYWKQLRAKHVKKSLLQGTKYES